MSIEREIKDEKFYHHFQPIFDLGKWEQIGYEALIRSDAYQNPAEMFEQAKKEACLYELDTQSIHKAVTTYFRNAERNESLFMNVLPSTIVNKSFRSFMEQIITENNIKSQHVVLEISENENVLSFDTFKTDIQELKKLGFKIAIDDLGKGYSNIQEIIELEPDFIKLDRYFSQDIHLSKQKQTLVSFFIYYCEQNNSQLVLEGIEKEVEMETAKKLGIPIAQGYLLGRPALLQK